MGQYSDILKKVKRSYPASFNNASQFRGILKDEQCERGVVKILTAFVEEGVPSKIASGGCTPNELNRIVKRIKNDNMFDDSVYEAMADFAALYDVPFGYTSPATSGHTVSPTTSNPVASTSIKATSRKRVAKSVAAGKTYKTPKGESSTTVSYADLGNGRQKPYKRGCLVAVAIWVGALLLLLVIALLFKDLTKSDEQDASHNVETVAAVDSQPAKQVANVSNDGDSYVAPKVEKITVTANGVDFKMVKVSGGSFIMGRKESDNCYGDMKPAHKVTVSDFYIGETEVTQELWKAIMYTNPSEFKGDKLPVDNVKKEDALRFLSALHFKTDLDFRLPTEAEWEFAARGGNYSRHFTYSGSSNINNVGWYVSNAGGETHKVASKKPNELGIYDMSGNVWEWCSDWYGGYPASAQQNPKGPNVGTYYVLRGGAWNRNSEFCGTELRNAVKRYFTDSSIGFRIVMEKK